MSQLQDERCEACRVGAPLISDAQLPALLEEIPGWQVIEIDGIRRLQRRFRFKNFVDALAFTQQVGGLAEQQGHHPALLTEWGAVSVSWWTHKIGGLHRNDFIMAAKTGALYPGE